MIKKKQINFEQSKCRLCGEEEETRDHIWRNCKATNMDREAMKESGIKSKDRMALAMRLDSREQLRKLLRDMQEEDERG